MTDPLTQSLPETIWLQVDIDGDPEDRSEALQRESWDDLTWCWDSIGGQEVRYVRADVVDHLRAEVEDWRKLLDPAKLHANLLQGKPAKLSRAQLAHLLGWDYTELLAEVEKLHASRAAEGDRLDWLLCRLPGNVLRDLVGDLSDTSDVAEFRRAIDLAAGFWPGAAAQRGERDVPVEMLAALDLDDVAAQSPFAQQQLAALRAEVEALRSDVITLAEGLRKLVLALAHAASDPLYAESYEYASELLAQLNGDSHAAQRGEGSEE